VTRADFSKSLIVLATIATGLVNWAVVRAHSAGRRERSSRAQPR